MSSRLSSGLFEIIKVQTLSRCMEQSILVP